VSVGSGVTCEAPAGPTANTENPGTSCATKSPPP
jgi:hypothetical protein